MPSAGSVHVDVLPDTKRFAPQLRTQLRQIASTVRPEVSVKVRVDTTAAMTKLRALRALANDVDGRLLGVGATSTATTGTSGGGGAQSSGGASASSGGTRTSTVRVNTTQATTALRGVSEQVKDLNGKTATVKVQVDPKSATRARRQLRSFSDISPAAGLALSTAGPTVAPATGAVVGGAAGLLPGLAAGVTGAGAFAAAAIPAIMDVADVMKMQEAAADGAEEATEAYEEALAGLSPAGRDLVEGLGELQTEYRAWQESLQDSTLPVATRAVGLLSDNIDQLSPIVEGASEGFDNLLDSAEAGLAGDHWTSFVSFASRQAEPTITSLGRTVGNLTLGITGLAVSFEPLWNSMSSGLEDSSASFAEWANNADNFTAFISWVTENGPVLLGVLGDVTGAIIDVGVAIAPLGMVYAEGIGLLAQGISWLAENAPGLLQLAVAAMTARTALGLLTRVNQGLIVPLRELPGRLREVGDRIRGTGDAASGAAGQTRGFRGALGGVVGALGGGWGLVVAGAITAIGVFAAKKAEAKQKVEEYTAAIREDTNATRENVRALAAKNLEEEGALKLADELGVSLELVTDAALGQAGAHAELRAELRRQTEALTDRFAAGELTQSQYDSETRKILDLRLAIDGESEALSGSMEALQRQTEASGAAQEQQEGLNGAMAEGAFRARDLRTALDELTAGAVSTTAAESDFQAAVDRATESAMTNGATLDLNTEAGRANNAALEQLRDTTNAKAAATLEDTGFMHDAIVAHQQGRAEFVRVARQMGLTAEEAEDLADEYLGIPSEVRTQIMVQANGTYTADSGANAPAGSQAAFFSEGGAVHGPGTKTSDSINARLSDGEFVQRARAVDKYGVGFMSALNEGRIDRRDLPGFASGGYVRTTEHAGEDAWKQINDHREDVRVEIQRLYMEMVDIAGKDLAGRYAEMLREGGHGAVQRALSQRGVPYSWGGGGPDGPSRGFGRGANTVGFDCSSLMQYAWWPWSQLPRVTYNQINAGRAVSRSEAIPGDLFFPSLGHVTMYTGNGRMVHAPRTGDVVRTAPAYSNPIAVRRPTQRANGGPVSAGQWSWVGEQGPELVQFSSPGQVYSTAQSARIAAEARAQARGSDGASAPLVGEYHQHLHNGEATFRNGMEALTHTLRVARKGGRYTDG